MSGKKNIIVQNWKNGQDKNLKNVYFVELDLNKKDYFLLDYHINKNGHLSVARQLSKILNENF